jgi:hypothetical protein
MKFCPDHPSTPSFERKGFAFLCHALGHRHLNAAQFKWNADVLITPGVPTTIFSSDDLSSKSKMQVEMTATSLK